jgi:hypothetical protein
MARRICRAHFAKLEAARLEFARAAADMAAQPDFVEPLLEERAFAELQPLLLNREPAVVQLAALALGRLAGYAPAVAGALLDAGVLEALPALLLRDAPGRKAACFVVRSVSGHGPQLASAVLDAGCGALLVRILTRWYSQCAPNGVTNEAIRSASTLASCSSLTSPRACPHAGRVPGRL